MRVLIGADYRGFEKKQDLVKDLAMHGHAVKDMGVYTAQAETDFNEPARAVAEAVLDEPGAMGILICDSAHGMTMQANRYKDIRAAHCGDTESARLAREHDDANILCLSARQLESAEMWEITDVFLRTDFEPLERRVRRINKLDEGEER